MQTMATTQPKTKYNIEKFLRSAPGNYSSNQYKMCLALDITLRTLEKYIKLPYGSDQCMSSDMFFKMVAYLKINQTDLLNP